MRKTSTLKSLTAVAALAAATLAPAAWAGHLNIVLEASLDGREQVSADATNREMIGDPDGRATAYVFGIDNDPLTLCYALVDIKRIAELAMPPGGGRAAHIHEGARGTNGPVIANLAWPQGGQAGDCLTEGEAGKFPTGEFGIVQRILRNPQMFYVNIHNSVYPSGAVRGQLQDTATTADSH